MEAKSHTQLLQHSVLSLSLPLRDAETSPLVAIAPAELFPYPSWDSAHQLTQELRHEAVQVQPLLVPLLGLQPRGRAEGLPIPPVPPPLGSV